MTDRRSFFLQSAAVCIAGTSMGVTANAPPRAVRDRPFRIPPNACDCHVHVIGHHSRYPMLPDRVYTPPEASVTDLRMHLAQLGMSRVVLIQPSFYGVDNSCLVDTLQELGNVARGIAVINSSTPDEMLQVLVANGVKGVRVNLESIGLHDPAAARNALKALARRIAPLGWHIQIYATSHVIAASAEVIVGLGVPVVLDHFALVQTSYALTQSLLAPIVDLVRSGYAYVKLSAPYRISKGAPNYDDVCPIARLFVEANPSQIVWASDWPHTDRAPNKRPTDVSSFRLVDDVYMLNQFLNWVPEPELRQSILVSNPAKLYGF
ncbi:2-pyrone-4,6-dicarboxylate hydrolase [Burkholderia orbicola]